MKTNLQSPLGESETNPRWCALYPLKLALGALAVIALVGTAHADIYVNANNASLSLNNTNDWLVGGVTPATLPSANDTIYFNGSTVTSPLGGSLSVSNFTVDTGAASTRIGSTPGATLTIGSGGIIKLVTGQKLELSCNLALSANQTWTNAGNNIQVDSSAAWTFNGYVLTFNGGGTFDNRSTMNCGTNVNIRCAVASMNLAAGDFNLGSGSNSFTTLTIAAGTVEGSTFPTNALAATSSAFGAGTCAIALNGGPSTLVYNGSTVATPEKITWGALGASAINVSQSGQTLILSNLVYATGAGQTSNSFLNFGGAGNLTLIKAVSNAPSSSFTYSINKSGAGTLTLTGTNIYTGNTLVNGGTFALTGTSSISNSPVISLSGGTTFDVSGLSSTFVLQSSQSISNSSTTTTATLNGGINASVGKLGGNFASGVVPFSIANGTLTISASTVFALGAGGSGRLAVGTYPIITKGTGGTVSGTTPYTATGSLAFPGGTGHLVNNSGELDFVVDTSSSAATEPLHWVGSGGTGTWDIGNTGNLVWEDSTTPTPHTTWFLNSDLVQLDEAYISANQTVTLNSTVTPPSLLVSNSTYNYTINGSGTIASGLTKTGNSNLVVQCAINTTGTLTNNAGTVQLVSGGPVFKLGGLAGSGGTLDLTTNQLTLNMAAQTNTYSGNIIGNFPASAGTVGTTGFGFTSTNSGKLILNGLIQLSADGSTYTSPSRSKIAAGGTAELDFSGTTLLTNVSIYGAGTVRFTGGTHNLVADGGQALLNVSAANITPPVAQVVVDGGTVNVAGASIGFGGNQNNVLSITINGGSLNLTGTNALAVGNNVGSASTSTLNLNGGTLTVFGIADNSGTSGTNIVNFNGSTVVFTSTNGFPQDFGYNGADPMQLLVGNGGAVINDGGYNQNLILPLQNNGSGGLTKLGSGTLTLATNNTYVGPTVVSNGVLLVNGSITSAVTVKNGGSLGGTGTVNSVTVNAGGTLAQQSGSLGSLTVNGNLTLAGNTVIQLDKDLSPAQTNDSVTVSGTLAYGGTLTVTNIGTTPLVAGDSFTVFKSGGSGSFTVAGNAGSGLAFQFANGVISVVSSGPSGPGYITNSISGNTLTLTWPAGQGWRLVSQTNSLSVGLITNDWNTVPGGIDGSNGITINPNNPTVFYKLVNP